MPTKRATYYEIVAAAERFTSRPPVAAACESTAPSRFFIDSTIVNHLPCVPAAIRRLTLLHLQTPGRHVFVRQYLKNGRVRVLHKLTVRRTDDGMLRGWNGVVEEPAKPATAAGFIFLTAVGCPPLRVPVSSADEAAAAWKRYRDEHMLGASDMAPGCGLVCTAAGETVARVSYNGRVWDAQGKILLQEPAE